MCLLPGVAGLRASSADTCSHGATALDMDGSWARRPVLPRWSACRGNVFPRRWPKYDGRMAEAARGLGIRQGHAVAEEAARRRDSAVVRDGARLHIGPMGATNNEVLAERSGRWSELTRRLALPEMSAGSPRPRSTPRRSRALPLGASGAGRGRDCRQVSIPPLPSAHELPSVTLQEVDDDVPRASTGSWHGVSQRNGTGVGGEGVTKAAPMRTLRVPAWRRLRACRTRWRGATPQSAR